MHVVGASSSVGDTLQKQETVTSCTFNKMVCVCAEIRTCFCCINCCCNCLTCSCSALSASSPNFTCAFSLTICCCGLAPPGDAPTAGVAPAFFSNSESREAFASSSYIPREKQTRGKSIHLTVTMLVERIELPSKDDFSPLLTH